MNKKSPERQCVGCGVKKDKREMIRVIRTQEGTYELDLTGRKNGRGAYICKDPECLKLAGKRGGFDRSFHAQLPKETYERLLRELEEQNGEQK